MDYENDPYRHPGYEKQRQRRLDAYRGMRNARYMQSDEYKNLSGPPPYYGPSRGRGRSMFRRRMLEKTQTNIQAAKISKDATQSITQRLESTQRDLHVIERYGSSYVTLRYLPGVPNLLPYLSPHIQDQSSVNLAAAKIVESLAISAYVNEVTENENGLVSESFNTMWKTSAIATPNVFSMISALRPIKTEDFIIVKRQKEVPDELLTKTSGTVLRLERYLTYVNDPIMMGMISACHQVSTEAQLKTAIIRRARAHVAMLPNTVVDVDFGEVIDFLSIPPVRTKDKQSVIQVMTMFGCSRHDGWGITRNVELEDVSIESLFRQFRTSFTRTDLNNYLDLTVPISESNVAVVDHITPVNYSDSTSNPLHGIREWKIFDPIRYELPYRMKRNVCGMFVSSFLRLYDVSDVGELNKMHLQAKASCIQIDGPNHAVVRQLGVAVQFM
ncbi:hypothetical protein ACOME3_002331 [Neoechinorhynchus agilis]